MVEYSSAQLSWVGSIQLMLVMTVGLVSGRLYDAGYFYHLMIGGCSLFIFSLFMLSLAQPGQYYQILLAQGFGAGLGIGIVYVPSIAVISHHFDKSRALAMGIATSGSGFGGMVQPIMLNRLFHSGVGFHTGVCASAALNLGVLLLAIACMRAKPAAPRRLHHEDNENTFGRSLLFLLEPLYAVSVLGSFFAMAGLYFPIFFVQLKAVETGIEPTLAFYVLTVLNGSTILGRICGTAFVRKLGVFNVVLVCVLGCTVLIFSALAIVGAVATFAFAVLYGLFGGAFMGIFAPMIGSLARTDAEIGARMGIGFAVTGLGGLIGTPIAGGLLTDSYIWWRPTVFAGSSMVAAGILFLAARLVRSRQKESPWV
ncbi:MFS general substrate transporter [Hymenopellis radicata]|nr:MFS general substrate transporter [Hymenopellis radicata]